MSVPDIILDVMAYEQGDLSSAATIRLFSGLVASGMAWQLQGHYGRTARAFVEAGYIDGSTGEVLCDLDPGAPGEG